MAEMNENLVIIIATNYEYRYGVHELHKELVEILRFRANNKFLIYKLICQHLGRTLYYDDICFTAKLNYELYRTLVENIEKTFLIRDIKTNRYDNSDICITFSAIK